MSIRKMKRIYRICIHAILWKIIFYRIYYTYRICRFVMHNPMYMSYRLHDIRCLYGRYKKWRWM